MSVSLEEARARLAEKFGDSTRVGGKGVARRKVSYINNNPKYNTNQIFSNPLKSQNLFIMRIFPISLVMPF